MSNLQKLLENNMYRYFKIKPSELLVNPSCLDLAKTKTTKKKAMFECLHKRLVRIGLYGKTISRFPFTQMQLKYNKDWSALLLL